jgi:hypothetical protein
MSAELKQPLDYAAAKDSELHEVVELITSCADPHYRSIVRRACLNLYRLGRNHEALEQFRLQGVA